MSTENIIENPLQIIKLSPENLNKQRIEGLYSDFALKTEDGSLFHVHKNILAATCPFFEIYFQSELCEKNANFLELVEISPNVLEKILEYLYKGSTSVSSEITVVKELLDNALFLRLRHLVDSCTEILIQLIDKDTCCDLLEYAYTCLIANKLIETCQKFIMQHSDSINEMKKFNDISSKTIEDLATVGREANAITEESLYLVIKEWIVYDFENRQQYIRQLIDKIHFDRMSNIFIISNVVNHDNPLKQNMEFLNKIIDFYSKNLESLTKQDENKKSHTSTNVSNSNASSNFPSAISNATAIENIFNPTQSQHYYEHQYDDESTDDGWYPGFPNCDSITEPENSDLFADESQNYDELQYNDEFIEELQSTDEFPDYVSTSESEYDLPIDEYSNNNEFIIELENNESMDDDELYNYNYGHELYNYNYGHELYNNGGSQYHDDESQYDDGGFEFYNDEPESDDD